MFVCAVFVAIATILTFTWWLWSKKSNTFFKKLNVPYIPAPMLGGHLKDMILQRKAITDVLMDIYHDPATKNEPVVGVRFLHIHGLVVKDLELIKRILVKDFNTFQDRRTATDIHTDVLGGSNMFMLKNPTWRKVRNKISPVFTGNKIRAMFDLVNGVGKDLNRYLEKNIPTRMDVDIKEIAALFTTDVIATCAYGIQANSLRDPQSEFRRNGKEIFNFNIKRAIEFGLPFFWPEVIPFLKLRMFGKESTEFLTNTLIDVMDEREKNQIIRNDLIDVLIGLRKESREERSEGKSDVTFDDNMLIAQAAIFFTAGFETTSSAIGFTLYELAKQPDVQQRLREEIKEFLKTNNNQITYENISELKYLDMCCQETLRMYPPLAYIDRECGEDFYSLEPISSFKVPRGFPIYIPAFALQRDEKYFPNPSKYNPERFSEEKKGSIPSYAYLPFGLGPRECLGKRFGLIQVKLGLIYFLRSHYVEVCDETQLDMQFHRLAMLVTPKQPNILRVRREVGGD